MSDPIYGDRRCPTCGSIKLQTTDPCWYCTRRPPTEDEQAAAGAELIRKEIDDAALKDLLVKTGLSAPFPDDELDAKVAGIIEKHAPALEAAIKAGQSGIASPPVPPLPVVSDPDMEPGTFKLVQPSAKALENLAATQKRFNGPISARMASREQMEAVMLNVRALQSRDILGDAVQLARWLKDAIKEIDELRASNAELNASRDRLQQRIDDLHQTDPGR